MVTFDVIITTRNRAERVSGLIQQILDCHHCPNHIIVIDSSDVANEQLKKQGGIVYQHTVRTNQPYQRYMGYGLSKSEILIFFDDDVEIVSPEIFAKFLLPYSDGGIVGVTVGIDYRSFVSKELKSDSKDANRAKARFLSAFEAFTGAPGLKFGDIFLAGLAGGIPTSFEGRVKYFQGANMSFRREIMKDIFDTTVFDLYDKGIGKGEDKMLSIRANRFGTLYSTGGLCLQHPAIESHYFQDLKQFHRRTAFSRLYLSKIYCETFAIPWFLGVMHYYWFYFWRLCASLTKAACGDKNSISTLMGQVSGVCLATIFLFSKRRFRVHEKENH